MEYKVFSKKKKLIIYKIEIIFFLMHETCLYIINLNLQNDNKYIHTYNT